MDNNKIYLNYNNIENNNLSHNSRDEIISIIQEDSFISDIDNSHFDEFERNIPVDFFNSYKLQKTNTAFSPLQIFSKFFDDEILRKIMKYSNAYMREEAPFNEDFICLEEIKKYIIINIYFSIFVLPEKILYWRSNLTETPIKNIMPYRRFLTINKYFHISALSHKQCERGQIN